MPDILITGAYYENSNYMLRIYAFTTVEISISWQLALRWIEVEFHSLLFS